MKEKLIICVDAGGTSVKVAGLNLKKEIIYKATSGTGSPAVDFHNWYLNIDKGIEDLISQVDPNIYEIIKIQMGVSGISAISNKEEIIDYFKNKYQVEIDITSDTMTALYSILEKGEKTGIIVIAGTGVAIFGMNNDATRLIGGWGHIIRERGSSYSLVRDFSVRIIDKYEDGSLYTDLENDFINYLGLKDVREFNHLFYQHTKDEIARHSIFFKEASNKGSSEAVYVLKNEGRKLAKQVEDLMRILRLPGHTAIGLTGGLLEKDGKYVISGFKEYLEAQGIVLTYRDSVDQLYGVFHFATKDMDV